MMRSDFKASLALSVLLSLFLSGAVHAHDERPEKLIIETGESAAQSHFNWYRAGADLNRGAAQAMLEPLYVRNPADDSLQPWLAAAEPMLDKTYSEFVIPLRKTACWSDGSRTRFDAHDVVFSFETVLKTPGLDAPVAIAMREKVESVEALDRFTVRIKLNAPDPLFIDKYFSGRPYQSFHFVPEHVWSSESDLERFANTNPIGTGPYRLDEPTHNPTFWTRHPGWWGANKLRDLPDPAHLEWIKIARPEERVRALARGEFDISSQLTVGTIDGLRRITKHVLPVSETHAANQLYWSGWEDFVGRDLFNPVETRELIFTLKAVDN